MQYSTAGACSSTGKRSKRRHPPAPHHSKSKNALCCVRTPRRAHHTALLHLKPLPNASCHTRSPRLTPCASLCPASFLDGLHEISRGQGPVLYRSADYAPQRLCRSGTRFASSRACKQGHNMQAPLLPSLLDACLHALFMLSQRAICVNKSQNGRRLLKIAPASPLVAWCVTETKPCRLQA